MTDINCFIVCFMKPELHLQSQLNKQLSQSLVDTPAGDIPRYLSMRHYTVYRHFTNRDIQFILGRLKMQVQKTSVPRDGITKYSSTENASTNLQVRKM